ncbi:protein Jade-1 isoform X2 [Mastacembelus armatus]|uniref:Jade family PHD finger 2 n=1 Tax=Mastacembelus armatus TaxID=205130 RepID=A0A3Q3NHU8_9TELE|nr:E3 ubiquitin-protein ligase Jade-2 isoform X2 [Mastacembelus armatus]
MESEKKRRKYSTSSNDSDTTDSQVTSWSRSSKNTGTSSTWVRHQHKKPSEVFRTDFITAMKLPDSAQLSSDDFYVLSDPWRQEWEKGVQVPANLEAIPEPVVRLLPESTGCVSTSRQEEGGTQPPPTQPYSCYDLDDLDVAWLELVNQEFRRMALPELDELMMECVLVELESVCEEKMQQAIETEEGLGIEYDEDVVCDVCRSPEGEDGNEMVFCDKCNVCVHQACYGILKVPQGNWLCRTCALGVQPKCLLCPKRGGALKPTRSGTKWVHVSCALWIPEVSIGCPEKMEPITKVSHIPASRWALSCSLCREHTGTCIQCSMPSCIVAFHVTCAFDHGLEMRTILAENDEVRFKSFCLEHSCTASNSSTTTTRPDWGTTGVSSELRLDQQHQPNGSSDPEQRSVLYPASVVASERAERDQLEREKVSQRKQKLQELEDEFYRLVDPREVAENLGLPVSQVDFVYQFWKLKRKANFNRPLVTLKRDEVDNLAQQEQDVLYRRLKLFTHLRQDLERVRNLCYMVTRREKMKHTLCDLQEKIFNLQIQLLEEDMAGERTQKGEKRKQNGVKERGKERRKSSPEKKKERWKSESGALLKELGLSKSFPLDNSLFDSWLAQSVQITADDMLSHWALGAQHRDKSGSLLSDQLLQGEENLLNLMMENSMQSTWKTPQLGRKPRGNKPRARGQSTIPPQPQTVLPTAAASTASSPSARSLWASVAEKPSHVSRKVDRSKGSSKVLHHHHLHHHQTRSSDLQRDPAPQPPISKMDSCHISEDRGPWDSIYTGNGVALGVQSGFTTSSSPLPASSPGVTVPDTGAILFGGAPRIRLSRQGKSRGRAVSGSGGMARLETMDLSLTGKDAAETDGYFSDGEQSDSDTRSGGRKLRLPKLHSGNEDLLRRSVLAS